MYLVTLLYLPWGCLLPRKKCNQNIYIVVRMILGQPKNVQFLPNKWSMGVLISGDNIGPRKAIILCPAFELAKLHVF